MRGKAIIRIRPYNDINDLIMNTLGTTISGLIIFNSLRKVLMRKFRRAEFQ